MILVEATFVKSVTSRKTPLVNCLQAVFLGAEFGLIPCSRKTASGNLPLSLSLSLSLICLIAVRL